jgi:hypothetical protein
VARGCNPDKSQFATMFVAQYDHPAWTFLSFDS